MVGRMVVGRPAGPRTHRLHYVAGQSGAHDWLPVPDAARRGFMAVETILRQRVVRHPGPLLGSDPYPARRWKAGTTSAAS
jgi:hypothetical protein